MSSDLARYCADAARHFWGEPNKALSTGKTLRWGSHGARKLEVESGVWHDHESGTGGGTLDLIRREARLEGKAAIDFLRDTLGADIEDTPGRSPPPSPSRKIVATFDYVDEMGDLLFQVVRFEPKGFSQRRKDPSKRDGWAYEVRGVRQVLYRLPEVIEAAALGRSVFIVEGERKADALWALGVPATCNAGGAGKWPKECADEHLSGADVVILPDNDAPGKKHAKAVADALDGVAERVISVDLPDLGPKGDIINWLAAGGDADQLYALVNDERGSAGRFRSRFGAIFWADLDRLPPSRDWLIDDMLYGGDYGLMYGASKSGKSFLATDAGLSIARGRSFLGKKTRQGGVIYQAGEGGLGLVSRLRAYRLMHGISNDADVPFILLPAKVDLFSREGDAEAFIEEIEGLRAHLTAPLELLIIDTFSTASPGANENASEDMSRVLANIERIKAQARCAVLVVHHMNAAGERPRGHSSLYANADSAFEVSRDKEFPADRRMKIDKVKDAEDGQVIPFHLHSVTLGYRDEDGKPITSCVVNHQEAEDRPLLDDKPPRQPLTSAQHLFLSSLKAAVLEHGRIAPAAVKTEDAYTRVVEWAEFTNEYGRRADPEKNEEAVRKQLSRDGDALLRKALIGRDKPFIWITRDGLRHA